MSIQIQKQGLLDTIQDHGRYGYQHLGINPGGAMDTAAMRIANALVGNQVNEPVIEMHFPAAEILFEQTVLIAFGGADLAATINEQPVPVLRSLLVSKGSRLRFHKQSQGASVYMAVHGGWEADQWLGSCSTNMEVKAGGFHGKPLRTNDRIALKHKKIFSGHNESQPFFLFPWWANTMSVYNTGNIRIIAGAEYEQLNQLSKQQLAHEPFVIQVQSNRMGYRLISKPLQRKESAELISTAATRGTVQLLPNGQLIILMADHQTTGGYPRVGHVISADIPSLAQKKSGEPVCFQVIDIKEAEQRAYEFEQNLQQLENSCIFRLEAYLRR